MSEPLVVDLFVEDRAHEEFLKPLLLRVAEEEGFQVDVRIRSARGGHGKAIQEFQTYQKLVQRGLLDAPALVVVGIDGNCKPFAKKKREIEGATFRSLSSKVVAACPSPHVERWYLADPDSFFQVVGYRPALGKEKCARDHYRRLLASAVRAGGHPATLGGIEFARELVEAMDWYRACKNDQSLKAFLDELRGWLRQQASGRN
jgi:hypothetical protein